MKRIIAAIVFISIFLSVSACTKTETKNIGKTLTTTEINSLITTTETTTQKFITKSKYLIDNANLLTDKEKHLIITDLDDIRSNIQFDTAILTTESFDSKVVDDYAANYFEKAGYGYGENKDGCLLIINKTDREWYLYTNGFGTTAISDDYGIDYISEKFLPQLKNNKYGDAILTFVNYVKEFVTQANYGEPYSDRNPYSDVREEIETPTKGSKTTNRATTAYVDNYAGIYTDLEANVWYQYKQYPYLKIYNTVVKDCDTNSYNNSCSVTHYPVCCVCHISSNYPKHTAVQFDSTVEEKYYCSNCGATTYVELKLNELL
ncbi:MAG: TPM domain-containing protein [Eubacterium sp.]|nr:TPM domain-containing protein [Eubacterium sp.]